MVEENCVPYGGDASAGIYVCADCGHIYSNQLKTSLPPCPDLDLSVHPKRCWSVITVHGDESDEIGDPMNLDDLYPKA